MLPVRLRLIALISLLLTQVSAARPASPLEVVLNGAGAGRVFDGLGATI